MFPYPIFLTNLDERLCIVIGGGHEAEGKVRGLLDCHANITLIAPELTPQLQKWVDEGEVMWLQRGYRYGDLRSAFLVLAEKSDPTTNAQIYDEAMAERALVTVMDDIPHCSIVAGSVVRQGPLVITVSTSGAAPALAVRLRERFEREFDAAYGVFLRWVQNIRPIMSDSYPFQQRKKRYYDLVDSEIISLIRQGSLNVARDRFRTLSHLPNLTDNQLCCHPATPCQGGRCVYLQLQQEKGGSDEPSIKDENA